MRGWDSIICRRILHAALTSEMLISLSDQPMQGVVGVENVLRAPRAGIAKGALKYWQNLDPYYNGTGSYMRRYFHPGGSITADPGDVVWGGHECFFSIITSLVGDGKTRNHYVRM